MYGKNMKKGFSEMFLVFLVCFHVCFGILLDTPQWSSLVEHSHVSSFSVCCQNVST